MNSSIVITKNAKKIPHQVCGDLLGDCVKLQRILGSVTILEKMFEPIVHNTSNDVCDDSLDELDKSAHRYHPLSVSNFRVGW